ncbi:WLM domain-containing protein [Xylariales sp. PMI_506]|nr:WLM domain-containing protein [Xylariales sp. PMI_506]
MADQPHGKDAPGDNEASVAVILSHQGSSHTLSFPTSGTITDLSAAVELELSIPTSNQKFLVPKLGLLKPPFKNPDLPLSQLGDKPIKLMGTTASEIESLASASQAASAREAALAAQRRNQPRAFTARRSATAAAEDSTYTFLSIRPLPNLPNPDRSRAFLERLKADPGIVTAMRKHKFTVGLLTEMDPLTYTESSHEGTTRILGLNRNKGEVIELRLRTDAYDGYRDYKTIRNTLCHELAHNVHGPHDRQFWDLCHQIEREVAAADWKSGGRSVSGDAYYEPSEEIAYDHGGWTGGEFVLGGGSGRASSSTAGSTAGAAPGGPGSLSRRDILAKAAEERLKKMSEEQQKRQNRPGEGSS